MIHIELGYGPNYPEWLQARPMADYLLVTGPFKWELLNSGFLCVYGPVQQVFIPAQYVRLIVEDYDVQVVDLDP